NGTSCRLSAHECAPTHRTNAHQHAKNRRKPRCACRGLRPPGRLRPPVAAGLLVPPAFQPDVQPFLFITPRNAGAAVVLVLIALALRRSWPSTRADRLGLIWTGALLQGFFLMAGYWAIVNGLQVGVAALIAALQPGLTALFAAVMVGEGLSRR